jgi:small multidrug resistance pump
LGVTLTVLLAAIIFGEALTPLMMVGVAMVIGGVLCVELGSRKEAADEPVKELASR